MLYCNQEVRISGITEFFSNMFQRGISLDKQNASGTNCALPSTGNCVQIWGKASWRSAAPHSASRSKQRTHPLTNWAYCSLQPNAFSKCANSGAAPGKRYTLTTSKRTCGPLSPGSCRTYCRARRRSTSRLCLSIAASAGVRSCAVRVFTSTKQSSEPCHAIKSRSPGKFPLDHRRATTM
jgi:hypothetical protein